MHIKQVIIQGFKSYRDQTVVEPFDKRHNVVVGRNGSGKSNFFYAIQFVLSDEYSHLRPDQRQALLHEGTGPRVVSAYVEIIFDNSDSRVPIEHEEIYLRRVIGAKKDQYFLNKKVVPRSEVMNLLESAGFSNSNPYYIVKQGKINQMATAPDAHRLKLLREVAGTRVYDERRDESMAILRETEIKLQKIEEFLRTIEERLSTLEEEKEELKQYQHYDKIRRALEYIIHEVELNENKKKLVELEKQRNESGTEQEKLAANLKKAQDNIKTLSKKTKETKKELASLKEERDILINDNQHLIKEKAKLDLTIKDLSEEVLGDNKSKERAENELSRLNNSIREKEAELEKVKPQYEQMKKREEECSRELALKEQKRKELYAKQGRGSQFTSKDDRDRWIQNELKSLNKQLKEKKDYRDKLEGELKKDANKTVELTRKIEEQSQELERQKNFIDEHNKQCYELKKNKDQFQATRNELWRKENNVQQNLSSLKEELAKADQKLRSMVGKPILNGRDSVRKVLETFVSRGGREAEFAKHYRGPVIENFDCEKSIYTSVEVTAGNRLFHHVVDTDVIGTQILKEMNRQKLPGEVNFMPLNRLNVRDQDYPNDSDAIPMVSKLNYDQKFDKAMRYLFGKTLICRNMEVATKLARTTGLDCITLEGDQVSSRGSLTGGFFNASNSRLEMQKTRSETMEQIKQCEQELKNLRMELGKTETSINGIVSEMQKTETKNSKAKGIYDKVKAELRLMREELSNIERSRGHKERTLAQSKSSLEAMQTTKEGLESELHQELLAQLSVHDQAQVDSLNDDIQKLQKENKEAFSTRMRLEAEKNKLENLLTNNLIRRRDEVLHALQEISLEDRKRQLTNCKAELEEIDKKIDKINGELTMVENKVKDMTKRLKTEQTELENWKKKEKDAQDRIDEDAKHLEKFASKQNLLEQKIAESVEKINQLGALPPQEMYSNYVKMSSRSLFKELEKANNKLKQFSHVNKKALDQFMSFSDQKEKLQKRKEELDRGDEKIKELISMLEQRKMEAIQFTFKQISKYFTEVFKKLVPAGRAKLVLKTSDHEEGHEIGPDDNNADNFIGIGIKISFTDADVEMKEMNQLSGGQKSLVALALIFAIQKCDPAPFYLFDEIDQALDPTYRRSVANMIHELSSEAQFITTTFRPELLEHANKFYGVKFRNKVSHVECVSREVARDFVEDDQTHA
ncbi:structural maintenance of chromosomes protein 3 [Diorhabda carinulata]|uniref:structural maintenance of chromosomes protein 3 n=1 Tax=Diorhabda carinulata TaxID=1163345 RepID=UPI0025A2DFDB|nr:structural maintenance of chromosomes protein 3 [Diorhabda carinulata]